MKWKKWIPVLFLVMVMGLISAPMNADSKDYKVIKRGVGKGVTAEPTVFKILVFDKITKKQEVKLTLPLALLNWAAECCRDETVQISNKCSLSLKDLLRILRKSGDNTLLEVDADDKQVKIWVE